MPADRSAAAPVAHIRKPDTLPSDAELKFLDLALEEQRGARDTFLRDFKLALLVVLAFQFLILLPFLRLSRDSPDNKASVTSLTDQQRAVREVQNRLERLRSTLKQVARSSSEPEPVDMRVQRPLQSSVPHLLSGLSPEQMRQLEEAYTAQKIESVRAVLTPLVRAEIIEPYFASLNTNSLALIGHPFEAQSVLLTRTIRKESSVLAELKLAPDSMIEELGRMQGRIGELHFNVPESDQWWESIGAKVQVVDALASNTDKMIGGLGQQLSKLSANTSVIDDQIKKQLEESESKRQQIDNALKELQARSGEIQGLLSDVAKPFKLIAVQVQDAVLYFPVFVALIWCYLTFEYVLLSKRARDLANAYLVLGLPRSALELYFASMPGATVLSVIVSCLLFAFPIGIVMWSTHRIGADEALRTAAPEHLFVFAEVLLFTCFAALVTALLRWHLLLKRSPRHG